MASCSSPLSSVENQVSNQPKTFVFYYSHILIQEFAYVSVCVSKPRPQKQEKCQQQPDQSIYKIVSEFSPPIDGIVLFTSPCKSIKQAISSISSVYLWTEALTVTQAGVGQLKSGGLLSREVFLGHTSCKEMLTQQTNNHK